MNIFIMSRQSPGPARPAHTRPRPGPSPMCLNCFQPRPGPRAAGRAGLGPKARPAQGTKYACCVYATHLPILTQ